MTYLQKLYDEYAKVKKPVLVTTSYKGSNDEEDLKTVPVVDNNNKINILTDSKTDDNIKNSTKNFFDEYVDNAVSDHQC